MKMRILPLSMAVCSLLLIGCSPVQTCPPAQPCPKCAQLTFDELCRQRSQENIDAAQRALRQGEREMYLQREAEEIVAIMERQSVVNCEVVIELLGPKLFFEDSALHLVYSQKTPEYKDELFTVRIKKEEVDIYPAKQIKPGTHTPEQWDAIGYGKDYFGR